MRRGMWRFSVWVGLVLLLVLIVMSGCSRSKSSGPSEGTEEAGATTQSPDGEPVPSMSVEEATNAAAAALVATTTAEAQDAAQATKEPQATVVSVAPEPTETTVVEATAVTQPTAEPELVEESPPATGATTHAVQTGENLYRIALNHGLTFQALAAHNGITNPNLIFPGQELKIPASGGTAPTPSGDGSYTVQVGDNLFRIALAYNMTFTDLAGANGLSYPYTIYPGQQLSIP